MQRKRSIRILSVMLSIMMLLSLLPVTTLAADGEACTGGDSCTHEAEYNGLHYATISDAIHAAGGTSGSGGTVTLLKSGVTLVGQDESRDDNGKIEKTTFIYKSMTLDLGGYTLTCADPRGFVVRPNVSFTIKNGTFENTTPYQSYGVGIEASKSAQTGDIDGCTVTIDGATLQAAFSGVYATGYTTINVINGGKVIGKDNTAISAIGPHNTVSLDGAEIQGATYGIYQGPYNKDLSKDLPASTFSITNSEIKGGSAGIWIASNEGIAKGEHTLELTDSQISGEYGIIVMGTDVTISGEKTGVTATGEDCYALAVAKQDNEQTVGNVQITGGTFKGLVDKPWDGPATISITGGTFDTDVSNYVAPGMMWDAETGKIVVNTTTAVAVVDGVGYTDFQQAIAALKDGSTMQIMSGAYDVTATRTTDGTYGSCFIIDKDNVTIKAADPSKKPVIYGFSNKFSAGVGDGGINGQDTIYVSGENVKLENLVIMPLGGYTDGGGFVNVYQKTVEVTSAATGFTMTGCETQPNTKTKDELGDNSMKTASGNIYVSIDGAAISGNSFGAGTTISAGWKGSSAADTYTVDVSGNYWGAGVTGADLAGVIDGNVVIDTYYTDAAMTATAKVGGIPVSDGAQLRAAVVAAKENDTIVIYPGDYDIEPDGSTPFLEGQGNWYLPITADGVTLLGVDADGNPITDAMNTKATIYSTTETGNGMWASQNLIAVFGDNVTISGLTIMPKVEVNKTVEVNGKNFTMQYCSIVPNTKVTDGQYADTSDGGSLYFAGEKGNEVVKDNYFKQMVLSFDSVKDAESIVVENNTFDTPYDENTQMISNVTWTNPATLEMADITIVGNTFKNLPDDYSKLVLQRMDGQFILEDNALVKADGSKDNRDIAGLVSFDDRFFTDWDTFVAAEPTIVITENGVTRVLQPTANEEDGPAVAKTLKVAPASAKIYPNDSVAITATLTGFADGTTVSWTVNGEPATGSGSSITIQGAKAGDKYVVTAVADGVSVSAVVTVVERPYTPPTTDGGGSAAGDYLVNVDRTTGGKVTVNPGRADKGDTVTITVKPDDGYVLDELTVTAREGGAVKLTSQGGGKYTFKMPGSAVTVTAAFVKEGSGQPAAGLPFTDVAESDYYCGAVLWAVENGITNGTSSTTFSPDVTVSRAQMVTFLWRAAGAPRATGSNPFTDVAQGAWYYDAVLWAVQNGITNGTNAAGTTFSPDEPVTRAQAVTFQWRAAGSPAVSGSGFEDVSADAYYAQSVIWAAREGITVGTNAAGTAFSPDVPVSRAQAVTFLYRELAD